MKKREPGIGHNRFRQAFHRWKRKAGDWKFIVTV